MATEIELKKLVINGPTDDDINAYKNDIKDYKDFVSIVKNYNSMKENLKKDLNTEEFWLTVVTTLFSETVLSFYMRSLIKITKSTNLQLSVTEKYSLKNSRTERFCFAKEVLI